MNLERTILTNLERGNGGVMAKPTLWSEVMLDEGGCSYSEFSKAITDLEVKEQVVVRNGEDRVKVMITDKGRLRLMEK